MAEQILSLLLYLILILTAFWFISPQKKPRSHPAYHLACLLEDAPESSLKGQFSAILISKSNNLYRQKKRFNRWQNRDRQSVLDGCNFSYSVIMRVMTFLVGVLKSASSIKMRIAAINFA